MVYCDTLGWAPPSDLKPRVDFILDVFSRKLSLLRKPAQGRFVAHKPQSHVRGFHKCTSNCFYNIPLQSCGNICGVIVTIMGAISCIDPTLWRFGFLATKSTLPKEISNIPCMLFAKGAYPLTDCKEYQSTVTWDQFLPTISVEWQPLVRTTVFQ